MAKELEGEKVRGKGTTERVVREVDDNEGCGVEERGRNDVGEVVVWKTESFEGAEKSQFRGNVTAEALVRERELRNSVAGAGHAGPVACSGVVF